MKRLQEKPDTEQTFHQLSRRLPWTTVTLGFFLTVDRLPIKMHLVHRSLVIDSALLSTRSLPCLSSLGGTTMTRRDARVIRAWHCMLLVLMSGCVAAFPDDGAEIAEFVHSLSAEDSKTGEVRELVHDFGTVLGSGRVLRHEFALPNSTSEAARLVEVTAHAPCCSFVEGVPKEIPAHGSAKVTTLLKTTAKTGLVEAAFTVETTSAEQARWKMRLTATVIPEVEVVADSGSDEAFLVGRPGRQKFRIYCRRREDEGQAEPTALVTSSNIRAEFDGPAIERTLPHGIIESARQVVVDLPAKRVDGVPL